MRLDFQEEHGYWLNPWGEAPYPMVPVMLIGNRGKSVETYALIDTGSDYTLFHAAWAERIGLDVFSGREDTLKGINPDPKSAITCFHHRVRVKVGLVNTFSQVAFSYDIGEEPESQLLGRLDVFDQMRIGLRQSVQTLYIGHQS